MPNLLQEGSPQAAKVQGKGWDDKSQDARIDSEIY